MKRLLVILSFLLFSCLAIGQSVTLQDFVGKFTFQSFTGGGSSDVTGTLDAFSDQTNQYFANSIQVGDVIWDNQGNRWEVMAVNSANLLQADVDLRNVNAVGGAPVGVGYVSRETPNMGLSLFVPDNNIGISQQLKSRIESHNMLLIDQYVAAQQDSVFTGASAADTSNVSNPAVGDVLVADDGAIAYYDGDSWVVKEPGTWLKPEWENGNVGISAGANDLYVEFEDYNYFNLNTNYLDAYYEDLDGNWGSIFASKDNSFMASSLGGAYASINVGSPSRKDIRNDVRLPSGASLAMGINAQGGYYTADSTIQFIHRAAGGGDNRFIQMKASDGNVHFYNEKYYLPNAAPPYAQSIIQWNTSGVPSWTDLSGLSGGGGTWLKPELEAGDVYIGSDYQLDIWDNTESVRKSVTAEGFEVEDINWGYTGVFYPDKIEFDDPDGNATKSTLNSAGLILDDDGSYEFDLDARKFTFTDNPNGIDLSLSAEQFLASGMNTFETTLNNSGVFSVKDYAGSDRLRITEDANIAINATTGFTATTTSGILGLTHSGSTGQLIIQSQDERATFQGEDTRVNGDTIITLNAAAGDAEITIKENSIQLVDLPDDNSPVKYLGVTAGRLVVEADAPAGGAGDDWGSQVVVSDETLNGDGTIGSPLTVNPTSDKNGIISALPAGDVDVNNASDNDLSITQGNGNEFTVDFGGVNGPAIYTGDVSGGNLATIDATQLYISENGNSASYLLDGIQFDNQNGVLNPQLSEFLAGDITLRQANGTASGNKFPQIRLRQYGDGYPRMVFSSGDDANNDKDLFDTDPIGAGAILGAIEFHGQNAAGDATTDAKNVLAAGINGVSQETFSGAASGARLEFYTTPIGTTGAVATMMLEDDGVLRLPRMPTTAIQDPASDYQMDPSGNIIRTSPTHSGVFSGSTDADGEVTITHGTGTDPDYADLMIQSTTTPYFVTLVSTSSTEATFKVWDASTGTAVASTGITASWIVK